MAGVQASHGVTEGLSAVRDDLMRPRDALENSVHRAPGTPAPISRDIRRPDGTRTGRRIERSTITRCGNGCGTEIRSEGRPLD